MNHGMRLLMRDNDTPAESQVASRSAWWHNLTAESIRADLLAGLLGALLVLPQGVAFARLAGMPAEYGIYSAIVPCIVAALFGASHHVVSGPTNANSLALFAMISPLAIAGSPEYVRLVLTATLMVGILQCAIAAARLGALANFISPAVLLGFTSGAACLIGYHAGLDLKQLCFGQQGLDAAEVGIALGTISTTALVASVRPRWPAMLIGLSAGYVLAAASHALYGRTSVRLGTLPSVIPPLSMPDLSINTLTDLSGAALALTIVALGQSISIAKAVAERSGQHIDPSREFLGQGLANVLGSFTSSYLSCGSLNRSMPNYDAGARTPLAAVFSALLLLVLVSASADVLAGIPISAIAALLIYVAWTLINTKEIRQVFRFGRQETACLIVTWLATLAIPVEFAILIGVGLSLVFYLYKTSRPVMRVLVPHGDGRRFTPVTDIDEPVLECPQLKLVRMEGDVFFGATQFVTNVLNDYRQHHRQQKHLLIMAKSMNFVDMAGARMWSREVRERRALGGNLYFHRPRARVVDAWRQSGLLEELGDGNIFGSKLDALSTIVPKLDKSICERCEARIFVECPTCATPSATHQTSKEPR